MARYSAKNARVKIGGSTFICKKWTVDVKTDALDVTNFESGGAAEWVAGVYEADITIELDLDIGASTTSFDLATPQTAYAILLYLNSAAAPAGVSGPKFSFSSALVIENQCSAGVRETVSATIKAKSSCTFSIPS